MAKKGVKQSKAKADDAPKKKGVENWRLFAALESMGRLSGAQLEDVDVVFLVDEVLNKAQKRIDALIKVRDGLDLETPEGKEKFEQQLNKTFTPSWNPLDPRVLKGARFSRDDLHLLRAIRVLTEK